MPLEPQRFQLLKTADLLSWDVWAAGGSAQYVFLCWSINLGKGGSESVAGILGSAGGNVQCVSG